MRTVIVTAATRLELSLLIDGVGAEPFPGMGHLQAYRAEFAGRELLLVQTGIGKVNAASATTLLLERYKPELLINTGCGGAFAGCQLAVGDLAFAQSETFADEGVQTPQGWRGLDLIGIPIFKKEGTALFNTVPLPAAVAEGAVAFAAQQRFPARLGPFLTVSSCSGTNRQAEELLRRFPGICENMEGAAVAQVAMMYGVPLLEVRGISNFVEDRDLSRWDLKRAVAEVQRFLLLYLQSC